jgi:hypothetical protein
MKNPDTAIVLSVVLVSVAVLLGIACDSDRVVTRGDIKNRVVTMPDSTEAKQAAADAKAAAAQAQDALKKTQDMVNAILKAPPAPTIVYTQDGTPQEQTRVGRVVDVEEIFEGESSSDQYGEAYEAVTFIDDTGYQKRFYPVCSDQKIETGKPEIIMYHWKPNLNNYHHNQKGCFTIDGYLYATTATR